MLRLVAVVALIAPHRLEAQVPTEGFAPFKLQPSIIDYAAVRVPDVPALMEADAAHYAAKHGLNSSLVVLPQTQEGARFADLIESNISIDEFSHQAVAGGTVHTVRILSPGALGLQVNFGEMELPAGARMFVYSNDTTRGAFTSKNNKPNRHFAVVPVEGDVVTVEVFAPDHRPQLPDRRHFFGRPPLPRDLLRPEAGRQAAAADALSDLAALHGIHVQPRLPAEHRVPPARRGQSIQPG